MLEDWWSNVEDFSTILSFQEYNNKFYWYFNRLIYRSLYISPKCIKCNTVNLLFQNLHFETYFIVRTKPYEGNENGEGSCENRKNS